MFRILKTFFLFLILIFSFISCQEQQSTDSVEVNPLNKEGVVQWATGSGNYELEPGELRVFTHNAQKKENGSVTGHFMLNNHLTDVHVSGSVICFNIIGNEAFFGGVIENSNYTNPAYPLLWQPGTCVYFSTVDNGEGGSTVDMISLTFNGVGEIPFTQEDVMGFCEDPTTCPWYSYPKREIQSGNIQIAP